MGGKAKTAAFIHDSYEALEKDIARGHGKYLDTLMVLAEVDEESQRETVQKLRDSFAASVDQDYTNKTRFQKAEKLYNILYEVQSNQNVVNNS